MSYGGGQQSAWGQPQQRSKVVFVGNLPFDYTEEQLTETFESVGPVVSFRLVFDHGTGKPKGFGFCEYRDPETAASALRNLQGVEVGGRGLRLDFADTADAPPSKRGGAGGYGRGGYGGGGGGGGGGGYGGGGGRPPPTQDRGYGGQQAQGGPPAGAPAGNQYQIAADQQAGGGGTPLGYDGLPQPKQLPPGVQPQAGVSAVDAISQTLGTMPPGQLLDIMSQMKALVTSSPYEARTLLQSNPQLSYALFQAMLMMNIVDPSVLHRMLPQPVPAAAASGAPSYPSYSTPPQQGYGGARPPPPQGPPAGYGAQGGYGAPPPPQAAPPQAAGNAEQAALIQRVLAMGQAEIDALPAESRATIMQIRQAALGMAR